MTQRELAEQVGVGQSFISNYERGARGLSTEILVRLVRALKVSADDLLGLTRQQSDEKHADRRFFRRLREIDRLSVPEQKALLQTLDAFLERARLRDRPRTESRRPHS
jgi:transcriptional regulator with XRE-family HTH domain